MKLGDKVKYTDKATGRVWPAIITAIEGKTTTGLVFMGATDVPGQVRAVTITNETKITESKVAKAKK